MDHMIALPSRMTPQETPSGGAVVQLPQGEVRSCDRCAMVWCAHSECIFRASVDKGDNNRQTQLLSSYDKLRLHIHEHLVGSRATCGLCENLFYHHILQLLLLFEANLAEVGQVRRDIGKNLMKLRQHVDEVHGRF